MKKQITGSILLLLTAIIWGVAFVAQSSGMDYVGPLTFNGVRFLIGSIVLLPVIFVKDGLQHTERSQRKTEWKKALPVGMLCGIVLCAASLFQQYGINVYRMDNEPVGKAGFLTALYIIFVPIFGIFLKRKVKILVWISAVIACVGLYFLCLSEAFVFGKGDILELICALLFTVHITVVDRLSPGLDGTRISCIQFLVCGVVCSVGMFLFEEPKMTAILACYIPILYAAVCSSGIAYTLQIIGQQMVEPALASIIMSLESAVSAIAGVLIMGDILSGREILGCVIMFAAIILAQLGDFMKSKKTAETEEVG